jgi:hypothetical protein
MLEKLSCYMARVSIFLIMGVLIAGLAGCLGYNPPPSQNLEIRDWYDLDAIRDNLGGDHTLMSDLDSTTPGYTELASPTANEGKGWQPIGTFDPARPFEGFTGTFDGQGYKICDLFINRLDESYVGIFGIVDEGVRIEDIGAVNVTVTGDTSVGGLVGYNTGTVSNSYIIGSVTSHSYAGGLVGHNWGTVSNSHFTGTVTSWGVLAGSGMVGGLVGRNHIGGTIENSYSTGSVTGNDQVGGLVGLNIEGDVSNSYFTGSVTGNEYVGGLVGSNCYNYGIVTNSYSTGSVTGHSSVGGLIGKKEGDGTVNNSFWDVQTSGQTTSAGGTGKNTTEMKDVATFSEAAWDIVAVANPGEHNPTYIWNIVDKQTYPFLSWQA